MTTIEQVRCDRGPRAASGYIDQAYRLHCVSDNILNVDINFSYLHASHLFKCRSNFFLDRSSNFDNVTPSTDDNIQVCCNSVIFNRQFNSLPKCFSSKQTGPSVTGLGDAHNSWNLQDSINHDSCKDLSADAYYADRL